MNEILVQAGASAVSFLVLWAILGNFLFKPFFRLLEEREARTSGDEHSALHKRQQAKALSIQIEEKLREARLEGIRQRDERVGQSKSEAQSVLDRAAAVAQGEIKKAEQAIAELKAKALSELPVEAEKLSKLVVERALTTGASPTIH